MLTTLQSLALQWYAALSRLSAAAAEPVQAVALGLNIPALSAFLYGLLGSLAPCQLTANAGGIAYVARAAAGGKPAIWRSAGGFLLGKALTYTVLGAVAILLGLRLPPTAMAALRKLYGPLMIVFGLHLLGAVTMRLPWLDRLGEWLLRRVPGRADGGAMALGAAYALAFCPTMALLFFGLLVPLGIQAPAGLALPAIFAAGTAVPVLTLAAFLALGLGAARDWLRGVRRLDRPIARVAGVVFLLAGLNDFFIYWFI